MTVYTYRGLVGEEVLHGEVEDTHDIRLEVPSPLLLFTDIIVILNVKAHRHGLVIAHLHVLLLGIRGRFNNSNFLLR